MSNRDGLHARTRRRKTAITLCAMLVVWLGAALYLMLPSSRQVRSARVLPVSEQAQSGLASAPRTERCARVVQRTQNETEADALPMFHFVGMRPLDLEELERQRARRRIAAAPLPSSAPSASPTHPSSSCTTAPSESPDQDFAHTERVVARIDPSYRFDEHDE